MRGCVCVCVCVCVYECVWYLQGLPLAVEQFGDVAGHALHQVLGVVPLDLKLALLLVINLRRTSDIRLARQYYITQGFS